MANCAALSVLDAMMLVAVPISAAVAEDVSTLKATLVVAAVSMGAVTTR